MGISNFSQIVTQVNGFVGLKCIYSKRKRDKLKRCILVVWPGPCTHSDLDGEKFKIKIYI